MKEKRNIRRFAGLLLLLAALPLLSACGGLDRQQAVEAEALFYDHSLSLPLVSYWHQGDLLQDGGIRFNLPARAERGNFEAELQQYCQANSIRLETYDYSRWGNGHRYYLSAPVSTGKNAPYCLYAWTTDSWADTQTMVFNGARARLRQRLDDDPALAQPLLLPYHLITDPRLSQDADATLYAGVAYELGPSDDEYNAFPFGDYGAAKRQEQFSQFYAETGCYQVLTDENGDLLLNRENVSLVFSFRELAGLVYFTLQGCGSDMSCYSIGWDPNAQ